MGNKMREELRFHRFVGSDLTTSSYLKRVQVNDARVQVNEAKTKAEAASLKQVL